MSSPAKETRVLVRPDTDALIIVDMQNDFLLDGAPLLVPGGVALLDGINALARDCPFRHRTATMDWHPRVHCSFTPQGGQWPVHCVCGTPGAQLHAGLDTQHLHSTIHKGTAQAADSYSAFADETKVPTGLAGLLHSLGVKRVFVCGILYNFCVFHTAMDAKRFGFDVVVVSDLCVDTDPAAVQSSTAAMQKVGITFANSTAIVGREKRLYSHL